MAFQQVPDTVEIQVVYDWDGENVQISFHAQNPGGYIQTEIQTLANQIDISPVVALLADQSYQLHYLRTHVKGLDVINDIEAISSVSAADGDQIELPMPRNVAFVIQKRSAQTGRSARGRVFVPGIPDGYKHNSEDQTSKLTVAAADAFEGHIDGFRITIEAIGPWDAVIVSRFTNKTKRATGVVFPWLTTSYATRNVGSQRRRM